jgi:hypothetical protein
MAIYRHFSEASFGAADIQRMGVAYEYALASLRLSDRHDPITEIVAGKIIQIFKAGEHDPKQICARALQELGVPNVDTKK